MARIIIASASQTGRQQLSGLLTSSGHEVFRICASGSELRRAMNESDDGVIVLWGAIRDLNPDELVWDFGRGFSILLIARPETLSAYESGEIFRLSLPCSGSAVVGAVEMLSQLHRMRLPRRSGEEKSIVERAKEKLMAERGITEPEAHRLLQRTAMCRNMKMTECALELLQGRNDDAR